MTTTYSRGHKIYWNNNTRKWYYKDTGELFDADLPRPCKKCGKSEGAVDKGKSDPCLGNLLGVKFACCGHGIRSQSYIVFENGITVRDFEITRKI